jgi:hypothetical protein
MLEFVHFVPGRLRLKVSELKHRRRASEAEDYVFGIPGVKSVVANPATGSLTINFDRHQLSISDLWERLRRQGYVLNVCPEPTAIGSVCRGDQGANRLGLAVITIIVEALAQQSAQALVRALL